MVVGARHRAAAIGTEANGVDIVLMPFEPVQQLRLRPAGAGSYPGVPEDGGAVAAARNQHAAIAREGEAIDHICMPLQQRHELAARELVEADGPNLIVFHTMPWSEPPPRRQPFAVRRQRHGVDHARKARCALAPDRAHGLAARQVPHADGLVEGGRDELPAVRRERDALDHRHMPAGVEHGQRRIRRRLRCRGLRRPRAELEGEPLLAPGPQDGELDLRARRLLARRFDECLDARDLHAVERDENVVRHEALRLRRPAGHGLHQLRAARGLPAERVRLCFGEVLQLNPEPARARILRPRPARQQRQPQQHNRHDPHGPLPRPMPRLEVPISRQPAPIEMCMEARSRRRA